MGILSKFGNNKSKSKESKNVKSKKKLHTKRKSESIIAKMRISPSVPTTVYGALNGDSNIINSEHDFVRAEKLTFSDGVKYPVFIFDDNTLKASGLSDKSNDSALGQISIGLKTSSGATGFVYAATDDSLSDEDPFIGIIPMHDAFEALRSIVAIEDYKPGWLVGLLTVEDDVITLSKTDFVLTMPQWWAFVNGDLSLKVVNDKLALDVNAKTQSEPFALTDEEADENVDLDAMMSHATGVFDDDDGVASNSVINSFVNGSTTDVVSDENDVDNGFDIPDIVESSVAPVVDEPKVEPDVVKPVESSPKSNEAINSQVVESNTDVRPQQVQAPVDNSDNNSGSESIKQSTSRDNLDAQKIVLESSVATLNDFNISISDKEFKQSYIDSLSVDEFPMLDDSNDPTGRIAYENQLRKQANLELRSDLNDKKAKLRAWFESERAGLLDALRDVTRDTGLKLSKDRQKIDKLKKQLSDFEALKTAVMAEKNVSETVARLEKEFEDRKTRAKKEAMLEIESNFANELPRLQASKDEVINKAIGEKQRNISTEIADLKNAIQRKAQSAASSAYTDLMEVGSVRYEDAQTSLSNKRQMLFDKMKSLQEENRAEENRRVADQADIARNDTQVEALKAQLSQLEASHKRELAHIEESNKINLNNMQAQASREQESAIKSVKRELEKVTAERDEMKSKMNEDRQAYETRLEERDERHRKELESLRADIKASQDNNEKSIKRTRNWMVTGMVGVLLLGGAGGFVTGELVGVKHGSTNTTQPQQQSQQPTIIQIPSQQQSSFSESESKASSSSEVSSSQQNQSSESAQSQQSDTTNASSSVEQQSSQN